MPRLTTLTRARAAARVKGGDGRPLQPFRWWHLLSGRKLLYLPPSTSDGRPTAYAVDVRIWGAHAGDDEGRAHLYADGRHQAAADSPAAFDVAGGTIEVDLSTYGLKRAHFVTAAGSEQQLVPDPRSAMGRRLRFDRRHPVLSQWIAGGSVILLVVGVGLNIPQLAEAVTAIPPLAERIGRFESPLRLPLWLNVTLAVGAGFASVERGLRLRYHWLLDGAGNGP